MRKFLGSFLILLFLASLPLSARTLKRHLTFHCSFDKAMQADFAKGETMPEAAGYPVLVSGKFGNAVQFNDYGAMLQFRTARNLSPTCGTIAFWVKETDIEADRPLWNPFFQLQAEKDVFNIGRQWFPGEYTAALWRDGGVVAMTGDARLATPSARDEWHHFAATYQPNHLRLYKDGILIGEVQDADFYLRTPQDKFTIGRPRDSEHNADGYHTGLDLSWSDPVSAEKYAIKEHNVGAYAMDEFAVFDCVLSQSEVMQLAAAPVNDFLKKQTEPVLSLSILYLPGRQALRILPTGNFHDEEGETVLVTLLENGNSVTIPVTENGPEIAWMELGGLQPGTYHVEGLRLDGQGQPLCAACQAEFSVLEADAWLGNDYGKEDIVLPGFTPLEVEGRQLKVWGRTYDFGDSVFPVAIINQGFDMLAAPVEWRLQANGLASRLEFSGTELTECTPTHAIISGRGTLGEFEVTAEARIEYDGFMKFRIEFIPPQGGLAVDDLRMRLEMPKSESDMFFYTNRRHCNWPSDGKMSVTPLETNGVITIGNGNRCLQWLTESDEFYYPEDAPDAIQTAITEQTRIMDTVVIAAPLTVSRPMTLEFALQAGPLRAYPSHWRGWSSLGRRYLDPRLHRNISHTYDWWARAAGETIPRDGFPNPPNPEFMKGIIPCTSMHFAGFRGFAETEDRGRRTPEWAKYEPEWERIPRRVLDQSFPGWCEQSVDTQAQSWGDWHLWQVNELFRTTGVRGLYYDDWVQGPSRNPLAGSGYIGYSGRRRPTHDIFNQRELHRRIYAIVHKYRGDEGLVKIHTSGSIYLPVVAFCDVIYEGEIMCWTDRNPPNGNYFDTYRNDIFRMLLSGRQYGIPSELHDISASVAPREKVGPAIGTMAKQRQLWAKLLLHDINGVSGFTFGIDELRFIWLDQFGIAEDDVQFTGYWDGPDATGAALQRFFWPHDDDRASTGDISVYRRPGQALLIITRDAPNNYAGPANAEIRLNREKLGLPDGVPLISLDMESGARTPLGTIANDILTVPIETDNFVAVLIKTQE